MNPTIKPIEITETKDGVQTSAWVGGVRIATILTDVNGSKLECNFDPAIETATYVNKEDAFKMMVFHWDSFIMKISHNQVSAETIDTPELGN